MLLCQSCKKSHVGKGAFAAKRNPRFFPPPGRAPVVARCDELVDSDVECRDGALWEERVVGGEGDGHAIGGETGLPCEVQRAVFARLRGEGEGRLRERDSARNG